MVFCNILDAYHGFTLKLPEGSFIHNARRSNENVDANVARQPRNDQYQVQGCGKKQEANTYMFRSISHCVCGRYLDHTLFKVALYRLEIHAIPLSTLYRVSDEREGLHSDTSVLESKVGLGTLLVVKPSVSMIFASTIRWPFSEDDVFSSAEDE